MIKLFRKLRQNSIKENRVSKYLAYAIGEIFLVVIGIILAIQFSNWNERRSEVKKEIWYLDNIANDMFYQNNHLKELKTDFKDILAISKSLLIDYQNKKNYAKIDSLSFKLNQLMVTYSYPKIDNTYKELLSSGKVSLIENDDLIANIIDFYLNLNEIEYIFQTNEKQVFYGQVYPVLIKYTEIDVSDYTADSSLPITNIDAQNHIKSALNSPKNSLELTNAIKNKIIIISDYLITVDESIKEVDEMIQAIDDEIDTLK